MTNNIREGIEKKFKETNPRATLIDGFLYFREEDVIDFLHQELQQTKEDAKTEKDRDELYA